MTAYRCCGLAVESRAGVQGKIKGRGTPARENPVCTMGLRGTRRRGAACRERARRTASAGEAAYVARWIVTTAYGAVS